MTYEITPGVPLPRTCTGRLPTYRFPLDMMAVGDSFLIPDNNARAAVYRAVKVLKRTSAYRDYAVDTRKDGDHIRVWRVA